ncbi:MAG TPA: hypothetical protein VGX75_07135 [bacterium]|nr:hypothetical protein [bacterium]
MVGISPAPGRAEVQVDLNLVLAPGVPPAAPVEVIGIAPGPGWVWIAGHDASRGRWVVRVGSPFGGFARAGSNPNAHSPRSTLLSLHGGRRAFGSGPTA